MSLIKVELHTSVDMTIGSVVKGQIKPLESFDGDVSAKSLAVEAQVGRRVRTIGYINSMPQYTTVSADQLISAMEEFDLDNIELEIVEKQDQQIDGRGIYLLKVNDIDVATSILGVSMDIEEVVNDVTSLVETIDENSITTNENHSMNTLHLVQRAIDELSTKSDDTISGEDEKVEVVNVVKIGVTGAAKLNPNKTKVIQLIKDGVKPCITLRKGENGVINTIFDGKLAGELEITTPEEMINIDDVVEVTANTTKAFGYYINVTTKHYKEEAAVTKEEVAEVDKDSLFVELMKPVIEQMYSGNNVCSAEDVVKNNEVVSHVWNLVNVLNGEPAAYVPKSFDGEVLEESPEPKMIKANSTEKKSKKITKEGIKKIMTYLASNDVPAKYINKIVSSYKEYPERYLDRIPSFDDEGFVAWRYSGHGPNFLKLAIISIERGKNIRLVGGKGSGKNTLLSTLACVYQRPLFSQSANRDTDITHLFGDKTMDAEEINGQVAQKIEFEKGLLIEAMEIGGFYELGEGNACRPEVTMALHSVLDSRKEADVNGYKLVKAHEDFSFVLTMNVDYDGCNSLNEAFRDRFVTIAFPSVMSIANILRNTCPSASAKDIRVCDKLYSDVLARVGELQTDEIVTIRGYINALDLAEDLSLKEALQMCVAYNVSDDELIVQEMLEMIDSVVA